MTATRATSTRTSDGLEAADATVGGLDEHLSDNARRLREIAKTWRARTAPESEAQPASPEPVSKAEAVAVDLAVETTPQSASPAAPVSEPVPATPIAAATPAPAQTPSAAPSSETSRGDAPDPVHPTPQPAQANQASPAAAAPRRRRRAAPEIVVAEPPTALAPPPSHTLSGKGELWLALTGSRRAIVAVGWFSAAINVLMLAGPLFMLQVYDRVMASGSMPTLVALLALTTAVYAVIGGLELIRSRIITRIGIEIDQRIGDRIFEAALKSSIVRTGSPSAALRDLDALRTFVAGPAPMTFFDLWWSPVYLLVIFATHWTLGLSALVGCAMLLATAYLSDKRSRAPLQENQKTALRSMEMAETGQRNAETIAAMGMIGAYRQRWQALNQEALSWQVHASDVLGGISSLSKALRLLLQSAMLAIGAALAVKGEISSGSIIAATIIFGRALAPVEQVITHWRSSIKAWDAYKKLEVLLKSVPPVARGIVLPAPKAHLAVTGLKVAAPGTDRIIVNGATFEVRPGQLLAVIGPSGSGKSSLTRALVGLWKPAGGVIKLDGGDFGQWDSEALGRHIGYLPQDLELFSGSVRANIGRFRIDASDDDIVAAAKAAHAHELIMSLPNGYDTELGAFGTHLSGGQRQRVALARALFGNPALVVLDEANANLDNAGDKALALAIDGMRARGQAIVFVTHRMPIIQQADTLLFIDRGAQKAFGPRDQVLAALNGSGPARRQTDPAPAVAPAGAASNKAPSS